MSMIGELREISAAKLRALDEDAIDALQKKSGLSLDKAWDGLRYLIDRRCTVNPIDGGEALDGGDFGYGPPLLLRPPEVRVCARQLAAITEPMLRKAYDPEAMTAAEVYPGIWDRPKDRAANFKWLAAAFRELRAFYKGAALRTCGVVFFLT